MVRENGSRNRLAQKRGKQPGKCHRYKNRAFLKTLGTKLKRQRIAKGYSIDRMYLEAEGLNRSSISRIERGLIDPQITTLKRYTETIGISLRDVFTSL